MIAFYYGLTGFACVVVLPPRADAAVRNFVMAGLMPLARRPDPARRVRQVRASTTPTRRTPTAGDSWLGLGPPLVIGIGLLLMGPVLMLIWRSNGHPEFFRTQARGRAAGPAGGAAAAPGAHIGLGSAPCAPSSSPATELPTSCEVQERPDPVVGPGPGARRGPAAGVNFAEVMARQGIYPDAPKPPCVVGYEVAGEVAEVGEGVTDGAVGDRVMAGTRFGGYAEQVVVGESEIDPAARRAVLRAGRRDPGQLLDRLGRPASATATLQEGERVLIHAAAGGVGIAATQIAKPLGAEVWGTASPSKHDAIRGFGVDARRSTTRRAAGRRACRRSTWSWTRSAARPSSRSYKMLRPGGRLVAFGASAVVTGDKKQPPEGRPAGAADGPRLRPHEADVGVQGGHRPEHADAVERPRLARAVDRAAARR